MLQNIKGTEKKKLIKQTKMYRTMHVTKKDYCEGSVSR